MDVADTVTAGYVPAKTVTVGISFFWAYETASAISVKDPALSVATVIAADAAEQK